MDGAAIHVGDEISLRGANGVFFHSDGTQGGGFSGGGFSLRNGWCIEKCDGSEGPVNIGDECMLRCLAVPGRYLHSSAEQGGGYCFGGPERTDLGWGIEA